ncbi:DUF262 domain-containing protein [Listeria seeligeri]|uniref:DUF262 domain-containing protein n=1 Tax=Listeria seeligeri TaxID=1640 RepID=UPI0022EB91EB|nr:DUF262 domain-containing protein [Listeria seeligeri]
MRFQYNDVKMPVRVIYTMSNSESKELIVDETYQRRSVWLERDKVRLIETMLLNYVIPSVFFWQSSTNPETGQALTHIVDGQQRINAILEFIDGEFVLNDADLIELAMKKKYGGKGFIDLEDEDKQRVWNYNMAVIQIDLNASRDDIIKMFNRLNLTEYNLNAQEKRNANRGLFHDLATEISINNFWIDLDFFTANDLRRMQDVQYCANILLLWKRGIIEQSNAVKVINKAYDEYNVVYDSVETDREAVIKAMNSISKLLDDKATKRFIKKKTQNYTIFSFVFYLHRNEKDLSEDMIKKLAVFVRIYDKFKNEETSDLDLSIHESYIYDLFKKYKQASSEGVNKLANRVARYDVLKKFLVENTFDEAVLDSLFNKLDKE